MRWKNFVKEKRIRKPKWITQLRFCIQKTELTYAEKRFHYLLIREWIISTETFNKMQRFI